MLMAVLLLGAVALGWFLAYGTGTRDQRTPATTQDRRLRWVERHPGEVNTGDVERVLLAEGLCLEDVRLVSRKAFDLRVRPFTMWMWIKQYGARELALAIAAETPHDTLLEHLSEGTLPDFAELEVFAGINGLVAAAQPAGEESWVPQPAASEEQAVERVPATRTLADLDVHDPGEWPAVAARPPVLPPVGEPRRLPPGWDAFFDDLAA